ncbi:MULTISPECIES: cobyrinate a,c-diamide synthase [unclassified Methylophaga]|uniref:cobyrinate a,c-diamide synthase n=1 Tax=unclassified Methylophaga TaxID=2629249 RepID=UPI000C8DDA37|nr:MULTISPECIES: cobyrinate a,c-diamide synthase [unclassified Methylophaga]MBN47508.1 cobyrinic acid a,c-diamide synthase [Methylophaga sp.]|tara:strand:- start:53260 stop:54552 length:1293 start_codon:yes stop_codon:yes gene_type:complete
MSKQPQTCAALIIAAPASGQGKTTVTATLAWHYRRQGKQVRIFKVGPDFLDPMILSFASGHPVYQVDLWMVGETHSRQLIAEAAQQADIILIEGVMGLFDGAPSTADLAATLSIPVLAVIDASAMAQTFAALAFGLANFRQDVQLAGVLANRVGSSKHAEMLTPHLPEDLPCLATMPRQVESLPSRYLGLVQADEINGLAERLDKLADSLAFNPAFVLPEYPIHNEPAEDLPLLLKGIRIGVAKDAAFAFIYQANLDCLTAMGVELVFFSPLQDAALPEVDSLYLPGGYPELHLETLSQNLPMRQAIFAHINANKPVLAECGGMLYLCKTLTDKHGNQAEMCGVLAADAKLQARLTALALQQVTLDNHTLRGHTYHHSLLENQLDAIAYAESPNDNKVSEAVFQQLRLTASYIHFYFPSAPELIARWFTP